MITAEEARKLSESCSDIKETISDIESSVIKAARFGRTSIPYKANIQLNRDIFDKLLTCLNEHGYQVAWFPSLNKLNIRW
jgi:hypothetical protein